MGDIQDAIAKLTEELEEKDRRIRELQEALSERDRQESAHLLEVSRLARAFQPARIRAWFWAAEARLTQYIPVGSEAFDSRGNPAGEIPFSEDHLLHSIHPEDRDRLALAWSRAHEGHLAYDIEYRVVKDDGTVRYQHEIATAEFDDAGCYSGHVGITQDISQQKLAEEEVQTRDAWLAGVLDNAPIEIVLKDLDGRIVAISRNVAEPLGQKKEAMVGGTTADFLPAHIAEVYMAADQQVMESGEPLQQEVREEVDGVVRYSLNSNFPLKDAKGEITGVCSLTSDITEVRQAEERLRQAQKMEAVGQLTGGVAHDFNNLLAIIQGNTEILASEVGSDSKMVQAILRASKRGAELTHRLLAFSRQQTLWSQPIDLAKLVDGMTGLLKRTLGETIEIETATTGDLAVAMADPGQVENALLNLAINARDAMPEGGKLTIECQNARLDQAYAALKPDAAAGNYVALAVSDNGTGMTAEVQAQAFEPFFTTKEVSKGSGLGLSMVYGFAKQSGGHVTIYSEEGRGTTVTLYLTRAEGAAEPEETAQCAGIPQGRGEVILVIEDDDDVRALAGTMLERMGYRMVAAADAARARSVLEDGENVDLVLSDVVLPGGVSGPEFAEELGLSYPELGVIFMSGYPAEAANRNSFLASDKVLLNKPFQMAQLAKALRAALD